MNKFFKLAGVFLAIGLVFNPFPGQAFNSAAHIYIADHVFPFAFDKINMFHGAIAPDLSMYIDDPKNWPDYFDDTHYDYIKLPFAWWKPGQYAFAKGWQTHNELWGADHYAHGTYPVYNGYVVTRADYLASQISLNDELAHFAIETAIDLLLVENKDPYLGEKLLGAALLRLQADVDLLAKTFVGGGATDLQTLISAESFFRELVENYGTALSLPQPFRMWALGELGVQIAAQMAVNITSAQVQAILEFAVNICQGDYLVPIETAIQKIRNQPGLMR
jgi:hypothetical protein